MESMEAEDPSGGLPEELIMPGRVSVMMRACRFDLIVTTKITNYYGSGQCVWA